VKADPLHLSAAAWDRILRHCGENYPLECCGLITGRGGKAEQVHLANNIWSNEQERTRRFLLDPQEQLRIERSLDGTDQSVIGNFHSHPDHPAEPSALDTEAAWPEYWYLIGPVQAGIVGKPRVWTIDPATGLFVEKSFVVDPL
jgi:proteasome lid subunit RPN8/RPN11